MAKKTVAERATGVGIAAEQRYLLRSGFSKNQLAEFFKKDIDTITVRLKDVKPCGMRAGHPVYDFLDCCKRLVDPVIDIEEWVKKLRPNDLPVYLQQQFWQAQLSRQKFDENRGELWRTERIAQVLSDVFKTIRQRIVMTTDMVDQQTALTDTQRATIQSIMDALLSDIQKDLVEQFKDYKIDDKDKAIEDIPPSDNGKSQAFDDDFSEFDNV